jgi:hypothetical protein
MFSKGLLSVRQLEVHREDAIVAAFRARTTASNGSLTVYSLTARTITLQPWSKNAVADQAITLFEDLLGEQVGVHRQRWRAGDTSRFGAQDAGRVSRCHSFAIFLDR